MPATTRPPSRSPTASPRISTHRVAPAVLAHPSSPRPACAPAAPSSTPASPDEPPLQPPRAPNCTVGHFLTMGSAGSELAVCSDLDAPSPPSGSECLGNDEIDWEPDLFAACPAARHPRPRLVVAVSLHETEPGVGHDLLEEGIVVEQRRVERQVAVEGVGGDGEVSAAGAEVDGLSAYDDQGRAMCAAGLQRVEQHSTGDHSADVVGDGHALPAGGGSRSIGVRHSASWSVIHSKRASPSAGMRPLPERESNDLTEPGPDDAVGGPRAVERTVVRRSHQHDVGAFVGLEADGGEVRCGQPRRSLSGGRTVGVRTRSGHEITARRAVLADVVAPPPVSRPARGRAPCRGSRRRPGPVPVGRQHGQGRLGAVRSRAVVRGGRSRSCNGARRRQPQRPPPVVRRPGCGRRLGLAVPTAGSAGHDRPDSHAARAETVGPTPTCLAPSPATTAARSAGGGTQTTRRRWPGAASRHQPPRTAPGRAAGERSMQQRVVLPTRFCTRRQCPEHRA